MKKDINTLLQKILLGFASGVMMAASVWSLLIPSMEMKEESMGDLRFIPAVVGFFIGIGLLLGLEFLRDEHPLLHPPVEHIQSHFPVELEAYDLARPVSACHLACKNDRIMAVIAEKCGSMLIRHYIRSAACTVVK
jgi:zinc transporter ZupT